MSTIHIITPEYRPQIGGVADYVRTVARGLSGSGEDVQVWCGAAGRAEAGDGFAVHPAFGKFLPNDLAAADAALERFPGPRRLIVQWVPHGYGQNAMNIRFCLWLWRRALRGDRIELMVHEPFLAFREGSWKQDAAATVHRVMTVVLLRSAQRVWVSIPEWEVLWRPYALGRHLPFEWLPVPSSLPIPAQQDVAAVRASFAARTSNTVGHLGTYSSLIAPLLAEALTEVLREPNPPLILLMGAGSDRFATSFLRERPQCGKFVHATGALSDEALAAHVASCDLLLQPYPDGVSSRRTTVMAGLLLGVPIVTNAGRLTEGLWKDSGAVRLTAVGDHRAMAKETLDLLSRPDARQWMRERGRALYAHMFAAERTISALRHAVRQKAA